MPEVKGSSSKTEVQKSAPNAEQARSAIKQVNAASLKIGGKPFGLSEARKMNPKKILDHKTLKDAGWKVDQPTEDFLKNARDFAKQEAARGLEELKSLGLSEDQISQTAPEKLLEIINQQGKGWQVTSETIDYLRNAQESLIDRQKQQQKEAKKNAGAEEAEIAEKGIKDPDQAEPSLNELGNINPMLEYLSSAGNLIINKESGKYTFQINGNSEEFDVLFDALKKSSNPREKAFAYDLDIAIKQQHISALSKNKNLDDAKKIQGKISLETSINKIKEARASIKQENGEDIPNILVELALSQAADGGEAEKALAKNSPLESISKSMTEAMRGNNNQFESYFDKLFNSLGYDEEKKRQALEDFKSLKGEVDKDKKDKLMGKLFKGGGLLGVLLYLIMKASSGELGGGQQQR